jgi:hypothetical protein
MDKFQTFIENQKRHMLQLDGADESTGWLTEKERKGQQFSFEDEQTGKKYGLMEAVYDNTINWITSVRRKAGRVSLNEQGVPQRLQEDTVSTAIATLTTQLLPAVRRIFQDMFAMQLVSVQPLNGPSGYLYYIDTKYTSTYADAKDPITALDRLDQKRPIDYAASSEKGTIRAIQFGITSKLVSTVIQKIKAEWTIEAEQDTRSQWHMDLAAELLPELTNECVRETDRRIIEALRDGAAYNVNWNKNGKLGAGTDLTSDSIAYRQTLYQDAIVAGNAYVLTNKHTNANWLIMNPTTFVYFQRLQNFSMTQNGLAMGGNIGIQNVGTLAGMYQIYVAPWYPDNEILMGLRGTDWKFAVGYYCPYIPLFVSDKYILGNDFTQFSQGAMSRYAYGVIPDEATNSTTNSGLVKITITSS